MMSTQPEATEIAPWQDVCQQTQDPVQTDLCLALKQLDKDLTLSRTTVQRLMQQVLAVDQHAIISVTDKNGIIVYANDKFCEVSQYSYEELVGQTHRIVGSGCHSTAFFDGMLKTISQGEAWSGEICNRRKNGDIYWVEATIVPTPTHDGDGYQYVSVHTEITALKRAEENLTAINEQLELRVADRTAELLKKQEEQRKLIAELHAAQGQLLQSEKMASIGQLAAGVAHEINNPIGYVSSNLGTLEKYIRDILGLVETFEAGEKDYQPGSAMPGKVQALKEKLDLEFLKEDISSLMTESKDGITRVRKIVQDLKDFSHVDEAEWQWTNLHNGLDSTLNIVWNELKYKAEVVKEYGDLPEVECFSSQINQVFMNLLVNAAHAIETHGTITIRTGHDGGQAWVEISDTGKGISPEHINRIFDPFFTTKPVGKGTGLGLSLSYSIMQKHHGSIEVQSEPGKGTTFRVSLPVKQPEPTETKPDA